MENIRHRATLEPSLKSDGRAEGLNAISTPMLFRRHACIYSEGEPAECLYKVVSGTVKAHKKLRDGRRQITDFYFPGDILGLETKHEYSQSAETITKCGLLAIKRDSLMALAERQQGIAQQVSEALSQELRRMRAHGYMLIQTAPERVAAFLLEMAERRSIGNVIELRMTRQDIADYLGIRIETVSRTITELASVDAIEVKHHQIVLRKRAALVDLSS